MTLTTDRRAALAASAPRDFAAAPALMLRALGVSKTFTLHAQGGVQIPALEQVDLDVARGECVVLVGPSGAGKSSLLRCLYGNYLASAGSIHVRQQVPGASEAGHDTGLSGATPPCLELTRASPHQVMALRRQMLGYVSQFLHVIPRIATLALVAEPLVLRGVAAADAHARAADLLARLQVPRRLWTLPPATFSGGEQQRVNIARGLIAAHPILLLDEPTASLDAENRDVVAELIVDAREQGAAIVGIFHDEHTRNRVATRRLELKPVLRAAA